MDIQQQRLVRILDTNTAEMASLQCVVQGLIHHIKETQGEEALKNACAKAVEVADRSPHGVDRIRPNTSRVKSYFSI